MIGQEPTLIDIIPGARGAVNYILKQVAELQRVPSRLSVIERQSYAVKQNAEARGDYSASADAGALLSAVQDIRARYGQVSGQLADVMDQLRASGYLSGAFETVTSAIFLAAQVALVLKGTQETERASTTLATKVLGADQASSFNVLGGNFTKYLLYGGIFYLGWLALRRGRGTRKW